MDNSTALTVAGRPGELPTERVQLSDDARDFIRSSKAGNTQKAYASQWKLWEAHCAGQGLQPLPADPRAVANWIADRVKNGTAGGKRGARGAAGHSISTVRAAIAAIKAVHEAAKQPFDSRHVELRHVLMGIKRKKADVAHQAQALKREDLLQILASLSDSIRDRRDAAILALGYAFARRSSELINLDLGQLGTGDGFLTITATRLTITLVRHKTQGDRELFVSIMREGNELAATAIERWLRLANVQPGEPIIRNVHKSSVIGRERLTTKSITLAIQRRVELLYLSRGTDPDTAARDAKAFSSHSLRHGFCATAADAGASLQEIMTISGHKSATTVARYCEQASRDALSPYKRAGVGLGDGH